MLRYLDERGIRPGVQLTVEGREPFGGPLRVAADGATHLLGEPLAAAMSVRPPRVVGVRDGHAVHRAAPEPVPWCSSHQNASRPCRALCSRARRTQDPTRRAWRVGAVVQ